MKIRFILFLFLLSPVLLFASSPRPRPDEVRAIWVTRFDYKTPGDVSSIVANCAHAGFTDIFFQVRGNGTAFYPSQMEPWAFELSGKNAASTGVNPGWNPLQTVASWAKYYNVRLHAYINVLPGWRGFDDPPARAGQLWTAHPDWFMVDSLGSRMEPSSAWYSFLNPAHPSVRKHLAKIAVELSRYDIAGLHLDYIRFPYDYKDVIKEVYPQATPAEVKARNSFSFDPLSLAFMRGSTSKWKWNKFRRDSVTQVVRDLSGVFKMQRGSQSVISASVLADISSGYHHAFQDSRLWAKTRLVDWVVPMNYNAELYDKRLDKFKRLLGRKSTMSQLVVGIYCVEDPQEIRRQIRVARENGCRGFALFAYSHLFKEHRPTEKASVLWR